MSDTIKKIIEFYAHHDVSQQTKHKVLKRLVETRDEDEAIETYRKLWDGIGEGKVDTLKKHSIINKVGRWLTKTAAILIPLIIVVGTVKLYMLSELSGQNHVELLETHTLNGENKTVVLPDGTKVLLKGGSFLQYSSSFNSKDRKVTLIGEAFFEVHHDERKPFSVRTPFVVVKDVGTSFNVSSYLYSDVVSVYVKSGIVDLRPEQQDTILRLSKDERLAYNVKTGRIKVTKGQPTIEPRWKNAQIDIDNMTISKAMGKLSNVYQVRITVRSVTLSKQRLTVHFNRGESLDTALKVICNIFPNMKYKKEGSDIIIY